MRTEEELILAYLKVRKTLREVSTQADQTINERTLEIVERYAPIAIHKQTEDDALEHVAFSFDEQDWFEFPSDQSDPLELLIQREELYHEQN